MRRASCAIPRKKAAFSDDQSSLSRGSRSSSAARPGRGDFELIDLSAGLPTFGPAVFIRRRARAASARPFPHLVYSGWCLEIAASNVFPEALLTLQPLRSRSSLPSPRTRGCPGRSPEDVRRARSRAVGVRSRSVSRSVQCREQLVDRLPPASSLPAPVVGRAGDVVVDATRRGFENRGSRAGRHAPRVLCGPLGSRSATAALLRRRLLPDLGSRTVDQGRAKTNPGVTTGLWSSVSWSPSNAYSIALDAVITARPRPCPDTPPRGAARRHSPRQQ